MPLNREWGGEIFTRISLFLFLLCSIEKYSTIGVRHDLPEVRRKEGRGRGRKVLRTVWRQLCRGERRAGIVMGSGCTETAMWSCTCAQMGKCGETMRGTKMNGASQVEENDRVD
jgi:hypothetical protein